MAEEPRSAEVEQRVHEIMCLILSGASRQVLAKHCATYTDLQPQTREKLLDLAFSHVEKINKQTEEENKAFVMLHLWKVFYKASHKEDLAAQINALSKIGQFCGLSERNPYRGKFENQEQYTDEDYKRVLEKMSGTYST